tara:strand:- start:105 stop:815 length:711 start_codon:yes stop_codon:yes gene_type:complete
MRGLAPFAAAPLASLGIAFSPDVVLNVVGNSATASLGTASVVASGTANVTNVLATSALGNVVNVCSANVSVTGVASIGAVGNLQNTAGAVVSVVNNIGTTAVGNVVIFGGAVQGVSSDAKVSQLGDETITADCNVTAAQIGSVSATATLGNEGVRTENRVPVTGVSSSTATGSSTILANAVVVLQGVFATITVKDVRVWSNVDDSQTSNFTLINDSQTPNWSTVNDTQNPDWNEVA